MMNTSQLIDRIISLLDKNFYVYIQRDTIKIVAIPEFEDLMDFMDLNDDNYELLYNEIENHPNNYFQIKKLNSRELYNTMMEFALEQERKDSVRIIKALRTKEPLRAFHIEISKMGSIIFNSWKSYYKDQLSQIIRTRLCREKIYLHHESCN